jgi:hypothetical protein
MRCFAFDRRSLCTWWRWNVQFAHVKREVLVCPFADTCLGLYYQGLHGGIVEMGLSPRARHVREVVQEAHDLIKELPPRAGSLDSPAWTPRRHGQEATAGGA